HFVVETVLTPEQREKILNAASKYYGIKRGPIEGGPRLRAVDYNLKAADVLSSDKAIQWFKRRDKGNWTGDTFWKKLQQDLQIPKEQVELLKSLNVENPYNREELLTSLLANYSYTIEINAAKEKEVPTQYYSNLTVPGGTNYTENEIATPAISPSIKGHARFTTDKGIGWFRSDEKYEVEKIEFDDGTFNEGTIDTKTRRILEVQSDLFQRGRDKDVLTIKQDFEGEVKTNYFTFNGDIYEAKAGFYYRNNEKINAFDFKEIRQQYLSTKESPQANQFLQLLNKNNNWVTFFIKSIIQDSAKKGYEKVLFPSGDTASKVEGHTTLEEFKKQKEDRIKELEKQEIDNKGKIGTKRKASFVGMDFTRGEYVYTEENYNQDKEKINNEINQLKQELERVEREGFGALRPIYKFYQETVFNILKKQG